FWLPLISTLKHLSICVSEKKFPDTFLYRIPNFSASVSQRNRFLPINLVYFSSLSFMQNSYVYSSLFSLPWYWQY
uniref:Uncharacterized protein n=1 Tax=Macaca fascicularis TaxID=9541 RepID=A0A7N9ID07_MACFA